MLDSKSSLVFALKILVQYKMLCKSGMPFSAWDSTSFFVKLWGKAILRGHTNYYFFMIFLLVSFQDEVKQLSSWKFFDWNRFGNWFGNDVYRLKK